MTKLPTTEMYPEFQKWLDEKIAWHKQRNKVPDSNPEHVAVYNYHAESIHDLKYVKTLLHIFTLETRDGVRAYDLDFD